MSNKDFGVYLEDGYDNQIYWFETIQECKDWIDATSNSDGDDCTIVVKAEAVETMREE